MKLTYLLLLLLLCSSFTKANEVNLTRAYPRSQVIDGISFPRKNLILYRGSKENQYDYLRAVSAMLGSEGAHLESPIFRTVRELLSRRSPLFASHLPVLTEMNELGLNHLIQAKLIENGGRAFEGNESIRATLDILNQAYDLSWIQRRAFDYSSPERNDNPYAFIYSSLHIEVAKIYSPHIVIFKEPEDSPRSLDVNYWNYANSRRWVHTNNPFPDRGEFLTPFYIPASQILGYQYNRTEFDERLWAIWRPLSADISAVFMKHQEGSATYVYFFDAFGLQHVMEKDGVFCSAYSQFDPRAELPRLPKIDCSVKPKIYGILKRCSDDEVAKNNCTFPSSLFKPYEISTRVKPALLIQSLTEHRFRDGDKIQMATAPHENKKTMDTRETKASSSNKGNL